MTNILWGHLKISLQERSVVVAVLVNPFLLCVIVFVSLLKQGVVVKVIVVKVISLSFLVVLVVSLWV